MPIPISGKTAYVVMPVSQTASCTEQEWCDIYQEVFRPILFECGYSCERAYPSTGNLIRSVITELRSSWLVLADLTDRNANVFYELGVRHSLSKRTVLVAQDAAHIPSDLQGYWWLPYGTRPGEVAAFRKDLSQLLKKIEAEPDRSDSPVSDFLEHENLGVSNFVLKENFKKVSALFTELSATVNTLRQIESDQRYASFIGPTCLDLLLSTLYVDVGGPLLRQCYELRFALKVIQSSVKHDTAFVAQTRVLASEVLTKVHELQLQLKRGEFAEPIDVSVMVWAPIPHSASEETQGTNDEWRYSRAQDLASFNLSDFEKHFENLKK
jgi:hypothetical protein